MELDRLEVPRPMLSIPKLAQPIRLVLVRAAAPDEPTQVGAIAGKPEE